jgi:O-6-methylguanine DNA methyltransferase
LTGSLVAGGGLKIPCALTPLMLNAGPPPASRGRGHAGNRVTYRAGVSGARHLRYVAEGWGIGELWLEDELVLWHELPSPRPKPPSGGGGPPEVTLADIGRRNRCGSVPEVLRLLASYFRGELTSFAGLVVDLDWCTPFQLAVAQALRAVPWGETVTYGELASLAGYPNAQRAAGSFCARNRLSLIVPCHRVVAAAGLGSYGSFGVDYKRRLLELEGAAL